MDLRTALLIFDGVEPATRSQKHEADKLLFDELVTSCNLITRQRLSPEDVEASGNTNVRSVAPEELVSIVMTKLKTNGVRKTRDELKNPAGWLYTICRNAQRDEFRKMNTRRKLNAKSTHEHAERVIDSSIDPRDEQATDSIPAMWLRLGEDSPIEVLEQRVEKCLAVARPRKDSVRALRNTLSCALAYIDKSNKPADIFTKFYPGKTKSAAEKSFNRGRKYLLDLIATELPDDHPPDFGARLASALGDALARRKARDSGVPA